MANSLDPVCSGSKLFASILNSSIMLGNYFADDFSRQHFQMHFFLGALRVLIQIHVKVFCLLLYDVSFTGNHYDDSCSSKIDK